MNNAKLILRNILTTAGLTSNNLDHVSIMGKDPILPTKFLIGEVGAASIAAVGYIAAELYQLKTGITQAINISVRDATLSQRSHSYLRIFNQETPKLWDELSGFYQDKNGRYIQFHCNFPHHRSGVVNYLKCKDDKSSVISAVKLLDANIIEQDLNNLGMCVSIVRTPEEWSQHPQALAVNKLPLFEIIKIGESNPKRLPDGDRPLSGVKVLDLTRVLAGPVCAKTLAEHGATVLHVASPNLPTIKLLEIDTGNAKLSTYLDLNHDEDKNKLKELVKDADIFIQGYRPGGLSDKGFSPQELTKLREGIICLDLSAYSHVGPWANRHGYDSLVQSATGIAFEQGSIELPEHLPAQSLDYITGYLSAFGLMEALRRRTINGGSYLVRVSLVQVAEWLKQLDRVSGYESLKIPTTKEINDLLLTIQTEFGVIQQIKPVLSMSNTMPFWGSPPVALGTHQPKWP